LGLLEGLGVENQVLIQVIIVHSWGNLGPLRGLVLHEGCLAVDLRKILQSKLA
jgi:hypothetical protein